MNKETDKKIILWEGFKKELPWILFWILLGIMAYGYYQDKQICEEVLADPCKICYELNQTLINLNYISNDNIIYTNISINDSFLDIEDKNPNDRTIS